jgi:beta-carotene 3-hydroxylase
LKINKLQKKSIHHKPNFAMSLWLAILTAIGAFVGMEAFSWAFHKYIMHGFLWSIHQTHHQRNEGFLELNDVFSLLFASISIILIVLGFPQADYRLFIGLGIALYGFVYFILHDVLIHRRLQTRFKPVNKYLMGISKAHRAHHQVKGKEDGVSFGLLWVSKKFFKQ